MQSSAWQNLVNLYARRMLRLMTRWRADRGPEWQDAVRRVAESMVKEVAGVTARDWRAAAMKATKSREIYQALQSEIQATGISNQLRLIAERNARLISSVPYDVGRRIAIESSKLHQEGARASEIEALIRRIAPTLIRSKVELIARTEVSKAETGLTVARAENIGIRFGQWLTSEDERVRPSHRNLNKVLMAWDDPPQPEALIGERSTLGRGLAGTFPNCRCLMAALADLGEIRWPCRVYSNGAITRMTRPQFAKMAGIKIAA
jgi:SPP1 gp7 family putative phage head morphogenesis protein